MSDESPLNPKVNRDEILRALKTIKEGGNVDLLKLPDLTPEEQEAFANRDTKGNLQRMLRERGLIGPDDVID